LYVLIGDDTALPAIARRLEELRPGVPVDVVVWVEGSENEVGFSTAARLSLHWAHGSAGAAAGHILDLVPPRSGDGYVWIAGESSWVKSLRAAFVEGRGHPPGLIRAAAYWRRGDPGIHEILDGPHETGGGR
jgi:NADPH-dependent ferric siderophore reductase